MRLHSRCPTISRIGGGSVQRTFSEETSRIHEAETQEKGLKEELLERQLVVYMERHLLVKMFCAADQIKEKRNKYFLNTGQ